MSIRVLGSYRGEKTLMGDGKHQNQRVVGARADPHAPPTPKHGENSRCLSGASCEPEREGEGKDYVIRGARGDQLRKSWGPVQNQNPGPLVQKELGVSGRQQKSFKRDVGPF